MVFILTTALVATSCLESQESSLIGTWTITDSERKPLNFYGIDEDLAIESLITFRADSTVVFTSSESDNTWTMSYNLTQDTSKIIYIGNNELMIGYRIKKIEGDKIELLTKYKKSWHELPRPNDFGSNSDFHDDYQISIVKTRK